MILQCLLKISPFFVFPFPPYTHTKRDDKTINRYRSHMLLNEKSLLSW